MKKKENKSLFLYTALIFIVALLLIILSFFGDSHLRSQQPQASLEPAATQQTSGSGLTERAAKLSEDNRLLLEQNKALEASQAAMETENAQLKLDAEMAQNQSAMSDKLFDIYGMLYNRKFSDARTALSEIDPATLTETQREFYDILVKKAN